jgi:hypothetical protein
VGNSNSHCNLANKKIKMTKEKLYNPDKCSSFKMMFGFEQLTNYLPNNRRKKPRNYENERKSEILAKNVS